MARQASRGTTPELRLRKALHARGLRFRVQRRVLPALRRTSDIVFTSARVVIDVRGCFWHACPDHGTQPKANSGWWSQKLARNVERDAETEQLLQAEGWALIVVWEHDDVENAADAIEAAVRARRPG